MQLKSGGLALKSAAKSNEKLVTQKYETLFLSWMPFTANINKSMGLKETSANNSFEFDDFLRLPVFQDLRQPLDRPKLVGDRKS